MSIIDLAAIPLQLWALSSGLWYSVLWGLSDRTYIHRSILADIKGEEKLHNPPILVNNFMRAINIYPLNFLQDFSWYDWYFLDTAQYFGSVLSGLAL